MRLCFLKLKLSENTHFGKRPPSPLTDPPKQTNNDKTPAYYCAFPCSVSDSYFTSVMLSNLFWCFNVIFYKIYPDKKNPDKRIHTKYKIKMIINKQTHVVNLGLSKWPIVSYSIYRDASNPGHLFQKMWIHFRTKITICQIKIKSWYDLIILHVEGRRIPQ